MYVRSIQHKTNRLIMFLWTDNLQLTLPVRYPPYHHFTQYLWRGLTGTSTLVLFYRNIMMIFFLTTVPAPYYLLLRWSVIRTLFVLYVRTYQYSYFYLTSVLRKLKDPYVRTYIFMSYWDFKRPSIKTVQ